MHRQLLLALSVEAMNDTVGPESTVLPALVFGEFLNLRSASRPVILRSALATRDKQHYRLGASCHNISLERR